MWYVSLFRSRSQGQAGAPDHHIVQFLCSPSDVIVEVMVRTDRGYAVIGEYRPEPGMRFVTIDNLVPEHTFFYSVRTASGGMSATEPAAFTLDKKV